MPSNYKLYAPNWKAIRRFIRFYRAKGKCEQCGAEHLKPHPTKGYKVSLACCHLDHDRKNNRFWNLKALCNTCHLLHDKKMHGQSRRYGRNHRDQQLTIFS